MTRAQYVAAFAFVVLIGAKMWLSDKWYGTHYFATRRP